MGQAESSNRGSNAKFFKARTNLVNPPILEGNDDENGNMEGENTLTPRPSGIEQEKSPSRQPRSRLSNQGFVFVQQSPKKKSPAKGRHKKSYSFCNCFSSSSGGKNSVRPVVQMPGRSKNSHKGSVESLTSATLDYQHYEISQSATKAMRLKLLDLTPNPKAFMSVGGILNKSIQPQQEGKKIVVEGDYRLHNELQSMGIAYACVKGLKSYSPNQDDFSILLEKHFSIFGVYDGHGEYGHYCSNFVSKNLPKFLLAHPSFSKDSTIKMAFIESFDDVHAALMRDAQDKGYSLQMSGTTTTVCVVRNEKLFVAHVGDSRAVLSFTENGKILVREVSRDHNPCIFTEKKRVQQFGGEVRQTDKNAPFRVFEKGKYSPGLAMTRSIGDLKSHEVGVIHQPDVSEFKLERGRDKYLLVCSDGIWQFLTSSQSVGTLLQFWDQSPKFAVEELATLSWHRWLRSENVVDDITVIAVDLWGNKPKSLKSPRPSSRNRNSQEGSRGGTRQDKLHIENEPDYACAQESVIKKGMALVNE